MTPTKKLVLELHPSEMEYRAREVLDGNTNIIDSMNLLEAVYDMAKERGVELEAVRVSDGVTFSHEELKIALSHRMYILPTEQAPPITPPPAATTPAATLLTTKQPE